MRKEVSIAIIIGVILGGIILYGIKLANQSTQSLPKTVITPTPFLQTDNKTGQEDNKDKTTTITSHTPNQVLFTKEITLTGKTTPLTQISIIWEDDETIVESNQNGDFTQKITLIPGENTIQIDTLKTDSSLNSQTLKLFFSTKAIE